MFIVVTINAQKGFVMSSNPPNAIHRLVAENEIRRLLAIYVHNLDDGKIGANADLLSDAKFQVVDTVVTGRDEIAKFFRTNVQHHEDGTPRTSHSLSNAIIDIETATTAKAVTYFTVHQELPGLPLQPIVTGRYEDEFKILDGNWRFASRRVVPRLFGELKDHVATPADDKAA